MTKFKLTEETIKVSGKTLYRIELTEDCLHGSAGDKGGFLEKESNLSGNAWISDNSKVYGDAEVYGNALVYGNAWVYGNAKVYGNALVYGNAWVYGNAKVYGDAEVYGNAKVSGDALVYGNAWDKSPLQIQGTRHFFNISSKDEVCIGCQKHTIESWMEHFEKVGSSNEYSEDEIKEYKMYLDLAYNLMRK